MEKLKGKLFDKEVTCIETAEGKMSLRGLFVPFFIMMARFKSRKWMKMHV